MHASPFPSQIPNVDSYSAMTRKVAAAHHLNRSRIHTSVCMPSSGITLEYSETTLHLKHSFDLEAMKLDPIGINQSDASADR